jgi:hypothetical protein
LVSVKGDVVLAKGGELAVAKRCTFVLHSCDITATRSKSVRASGIMCQMEALKLGCSHAPSLYEYGRRSEAAGDESAK